MQIQIHSYCDQYYQNKLNIALTVLNFFDWRSNKLNVSKHAGEVTYLGVVASGEHFSHFDSVQFIPFYRIVI